MVAWGAPTMTSTVPEEWSALLDRADVLIVDTETTGLGPRDEVLSLAVIDTRGSERYRAAILPAARITSGAAAVHGLTRALLLAGGAEPWPAHHGGVSRLLAAADRLLAYNARFDRRLLAQTCEHHGLALPEIDWRCLMLDYARHRGEPSTRPGSAHRWHRLGAAARHEGAPPRGGRHDALGDARTSLELMRAVARGG